MGCLKIIFEAAFFYNLSFQRCYSCLKSQSLLMKMLYLLTIIAVLLFGRIIAQKSKFIDPNATAETKALFKNLLELSNNHTLFGHQHATGYGHGWSGDENRSDVKSVTGSHPAVIGVDLSGFSGRTPESVEKAKKDVGKIVSDTYDRGGVISIAWHFSNPVSEGGFYWKDSVSLPAVTYIIPGGSAHNKYREILRGIGE